MTGRQWHRQLPRLLAVVAVAMASGCFPDTRGVSPDPARHYLYYPVALGITEPAGAYLLVANSNFDLQYSSGTLIPFDLEVIHGIVDACVSDGNNCTEFTVPRAEDAKDSRFGTLDYLLEDHAVFVGSYSGAMSVDENLVLLPVRADASVTYVDVVEVPREEQSSRRVLRCESGEGADAPDGAQRCSGARTVRSGVALRDGATFALPSEPYSVVGWQDPDEGTRYGVVGHMVGGQVSLVQQREGAAELPESCRDGEENDGDGLADGDDPGCQGSHVELVDVEDSFPEGTSGMAVDHDGRFLLTSRFQSRLSAFRVVVPSEEHAEPMVAPIRSIEVDAVSGGTDQRSVVISPEGERAYVVSREPSSLLVLDISQDASGDYADRFIDVIEVAPGPSFARIHEHPDLPSGYLIYVVCFDADRIYVIDPTINDVVDVIVARRGPHDLVFDPNREVAYVTNFLESTISILDVSPGSSSYHEIVTSLGWPRRPRTND